MRVLTLLMGAWLAWGLASGGAAEAEPPGGYRQAMRDFVALIAATAREGRPGFIVIPQNGVALLTADGEPGGPPASEYLAVIDGCGQESLFYGDSTPDYQPTPTKITNELRSFLDVAKAAGKTVFVIDYCQKQGYVDDSYAQGAAAGYRVFAADDRGLSRLPRYARPVRDAHAGDVRRLADARNFLALLDPGKFKSKEAYLGALAATDYDLLIIDACYDGRFLDAADVARLRVKANGGRRLVVSYFSIGEAEDYRDYWQKGWKKRPPAWLDQENPEWKGNYKVRYWDPEWQALLVTGAGSPLRRIVAAGFDGAYLDIIDAFEYFEELQEKAQGRRERYEKPQP